MGSCQFTVFLDFQRNCCISHFLNLTVLRSVILWLVYNSCPYGPEFGFANNPTLHCFRTSLSPAQKVLTVAFLPSYHIVQCTHMWVDYQGILSLLAFAKNY